MGRGKEVPILAVPLDLRSGFFERREPKGWFLGFAQVPHKYPRVYARASYQIAIGGVPVEVGDRTIMRPENVLDRRLGPRPFHVPDEPILGLDTVTTY